MIADEHLPDMSGRELIDRLRHRQRTEPVILLVTEERCSDVISLTKPMQCELLARLLLQWLALASAKSQNSESNWLGHHQRMDVHLTMLQALINDTWADRTQMHGLCVQLQITATQSGNEHLATAANELAQIIHAENTTRDMKSQCDQLVAMCNALD